MRCSPFFHGLRQMAGPLLHGEHIGSNFAATHVTGKPSIVTKQPLEARAGCASKECLEYAAGF
jgi:hypothetical protein